MVFRQNIRFFNQVDDFSKIYIAIIGLEEYKGSLNSKRKFLKVNQLRKK